MRSCLSHCPALERAGRRFLVHTCQPWTAAKLNPRIADSLVTVLHPNTHIQKKPKKDRHWMYGAAANWRESPYVCRASLMGARVQT
jgi:hypothetical protein